MEGYISIMKAFSLAAVLTAGAVLFWDESFSRAVTARLPR